MGLDIRLPIGLMFTLLGAMLAIYGLATNSETALYARSLGINVNLRWGPVLLAFGITMLVLFWRGRKAGGGQAPNPEASPGEAARSKGEAD